MSVLVQILNIYIKVMARIQVSKYILEEWCEKNMNVHTDWTGTRVETNDTCLSIDEFVDKLWDYLEKESDKMDD
jgi:hypothetical protein